MNTNKLSIKFSLGSWFLPVLLFFSGLSPALAEGSKDLYPSGVQGGRAALRTSTVSSLAYPFPNEGTHYVFAKVGETISLASSAQNGLVKKIRLFNPSGTEITLSFATGEGRITQRPNELAGPALPGQTVVGNQYKAIYYTVPAGGAGIYRVEFVAGTNQNNRSSAKANDNWTQNNNSYFLMAWDISVANAAKTAWIKGRMYATVLNMDILTLTGGVPNKFLGDAFNFYGKYKVLTKDGYVYNVDNNGNNGISFTFMVNNRGFYNPGNPGVPSYSSINAPDAASVTNRYQDPRAIDGNGTITQKIFYNIPNIDLPTSSVGAVPGGNTWLLNTPAQLHATALDFEGVDGTDGEAGSKGGYFVFDSAQDVDYTIVISPISPTTFPPRTLTGTTNAAGENKVFWDGKDGSLNPLPIGESGVKAVLQLKGAEVHFPYVDMEINPNGIKLELLTEPYSDRVFWNDEAIDRTLPAGTGPKPIPLNASHTQNPAGQPSNTNGHKWGAANGLVLGEFGDEKGVDTWTFILGDSFEKNFTININVADLEIVSLTTDSPECVNQGDIITYVVTAKNNGPSDVVDAPMSLILPNGYSVTSVVYDGNSCGGPFDPGDIVYNPVTNTHTFKASLPNQCEITFTVNVTVIGNSVAGNPNVFATIMRPNDFTDPDATNQDLDVRPTDPFYECANNGLGGDCNNIKSNEEVTIIPHILTVVDQDLAVCDVLDGKLEFTFRNLADGVYTMTYDGGSFTNVNVSGGIAVIENLDAGVYTNLQITVNGCDSPLGVDATISDADCICYKPGTFDPISGLETNIGITSLRNENSDGWPQDREGAWIALESKTKGFVPNRLTTVQIEAIPTANLVVGMMVYNITDDCLQINIDGTETGWKCFTSQGCD